CLDVSRVLDVLLTRHQVTTADYLNARILFLQRYLVRTRLELVSRFVTRLEVVHRQSGQNVSLSRRPVGTPSAQDALQAKRARQRAARSAVGVGPDPVVLLPGQNPQDFLDLL